jgi:hypothetical protein
VIDTKEILTEFVTAMSLSRTSHELMAAGCYRGRMRRERLCRDTSG